MTSREEKQVDRRNDEFYGLYRQFRAERMGKTKAVETAAEMTGYSQSGTWAIVKLREGVAKSEGGQDKVPYRHGSYLLYPSSLDGCRI
jgi:hypothetical protein